MREAGGEPADPDNLLVRGEAAGEGAEPDHQDAEAALEGRAGREEHGADQQEPDAGEHQGQFRAAEAGELEGSQGTQAAG